MSDKKSNGRSSGKGTSKTTGATITNINEARARIKPKEKVTRKEILRYIFKAVSKQAEQAHWPKFPYDLAVFEDEAGARMPVEVCKGKVVKRLSSKAVPQMVLRYAESLVEAFGTELGLRPQEATEIAALWEASATVIPYDKIEPVRFKSDDEGYCWARLDFDPVPGEYPHFKELMRRTLNREYVEAWIGSLFVSKASRQNYLWLHGDGGQGKSSLARFLSDIFQGAYRSEMVPSTSEKRFWTSGIVGARLVVFTDCNEAGFVTSSLFKTCTGDDKVKIEGKHETPLSIDLICKFMFISNKDPILSGSKANVRRLIYSEIKPLPQSKKLIAPSRYRALLWEERAAFIHACIEAYYRVFKDHSDLSASQTAELHGMEDVIDESENIYSDIFSNHFDIVPYDEEAPNQSKERSNFRDIRAILKGYKFKQYQCREFINFCVRQHDCIRKGKSGTIRYLYGLKIRDATVAGERNDF